ncbi:MAG TPA: hypothetical protein VNV64_01910, partial [Candidatus Binatia bacterium]|nr:hypothetical protein [Candidatus Binatia bacterium]
PWQPGHHLIIAEAAESARESHIATPTSPNWLSYRDGQVRTNSKRDRMPTSCEPFGSGNIGTHHF